MVQVSFKIRGVRVVALQLAVGWLWFYDTDDEVVVVMV